MTTSTTVVLGFDLDAGSLPLDFANTLDNRADPAPEEHLPDYAALLTFALATGTISSEQHAALAALATADPDGARRVHADALAVREAIFRVFAALADERLPADADLATLNRAHAEAAAHGGVAAVGAGERFSWRWDETPNLARPLWPLVRAAVELLLGGDLHRVRECAADDCRWLFLDTTRNRSRRWCSMQTCGNRAKVHEFRRRARDEGRAPRG